MGLNNKGEVMVTVIVRAPLISKAGGVTVRVTSRASGATVRAVSKAGRA